MTMHQAIASARTAHRRAVAAVRPLHEYFSDSGSAVAGLMVPDSLKEWRRKGWLAAKRRYKVKAFAEIDLIKRNGVGRAVFMDIGLTLPDSAMPQYFAGKPRAVVSGKADPPTPNSGHYVNVPGYITIGPVCVTSGRKQKVSWVFFAKYCDEAYAIIDAIDSAKKKALDANKLVATAAMYLRHACGSLPRMFGACK